MFLPKPPHWSLVCYLCVWTATLNIEAACFVLHAGMPKVSVLTRRYKIIWMKPATGDNKKKCTDLLMSHDSGKKEWQLGKTKVRLRVGHLPMHLLYIQWNAKHGVRCDVL